MIKELAKKNRSYRRFYENKKITEDELKELVDTGRNTPSAANRQPVRYKLVCDEVMNEKVFECLGWAGYLKDWAGPVKGERPSAYIIMATDKNAKAECDEGIIGQTILLAAVEKGMGGCFLGNVNRAKLAGVIGLSDDMKIDYCIALGYPKEEVVLEDIPDGGDIKYYRDANQVHHVPKIKLCQRKDPACGAACSASFHSSRISFAVGENLSRSAPATDTWRCCTRSPGTCAARSPAAGIRCRGSDSIPPGGRRPVRVRRSHTPHRRRPARTAPAPSSRQGPPCRRTPDNGRECSRRQTCHRRSGRTASPPQ